MKRMYRSIAVTVLAALMALPMAVRAEDKTEISKVEVTANQAFKIDEAFRSYVGEKVSESVKRIKDGLIFKAKVNGADDILLTVKDVKLYKSNDKICEEGELVWPFKQTGSKFEYDPAESPNKIEVELAFEKQNDSTKYSFSDSIELMNGGKKISLAKSKSKPGNISLFIDNSVYRKFLFIKTVGVKGLKISGEAGAFKPECNVDINVAQNPKVNDLISQNGDKQVQFELAAGFSEYALFGLNPTSTRKEYLAMDKNLITFGLDPKNKADALLTKLAMYTAQANKKIPYIHANDKIVSTNETVDLYSLVDAARDDVKDENAEINKKKIKIERIEKEGDPNPVRVDEPTQAKLPEGSYTIAFEYTGEDGRTESVKATLKVEKANPLPPPQPPIPAPQPPVPAPQPPVPAPQPKQQEKTGNAYFDLGRYNLPTCPDSKNNQCAKAGSGAKKDDVPNTAAAAIN